MSFPIPTCPECGGTAVEHEPGCARAQDLEPEDPVGIDATNSPVGEPESTREGGSTSGSKLGVSPETMPERDPNLSLLEQAKLDAEEIPPNPELEESGVELD